MDENKEKEHESDMEEEGTAEGEKVYMDRDSPAQNIFALDEKQRLVCVAEEELLYFQLPPVVPKFEAPKPPQADSKIETDKAEKTDLPASARKSTLEEAMSNLDLKDMPEGQVGKLIVYKSGKLLRKCDGSRS
ncbi:hypothetical protein G6F68_016696 [Rhizopus microsporus]|nr:hypothetical protein G6F68_016696 [Rhizopus microsporus]